jgi:hypothetical protein
VVASGQLALAAKPDMFLRFELGHCKQMDKKFEPMAAGEPDKIRERLADEGRSLVRPPFLRQLVDSQTANPFQRCALPPSLCFGQNLHPNPNNVQKLPTTPRWYFTTN